MRRTGVLVVLFALLMATFVSPAEAEKRKSKSATREAVDTYGLPWLSSPSTGEGCFGDGCVRFRISESERWVTVEVNDESSTPTAFKITQKKDAAGRAHTVGGPFCGSSGDEAVKLVPGVEVFVYVYAVGDGACPGAVGTSGTVRAVFSNRS